MTKQNNKIKPKDEVQAALLQAFKSQNPDIHLDDKGYVSDLHHTLLPLVSPPDFVGDLKAGRGGELNLQKNNAPPKFHAVHSSAGLAVNCFAPFKDKENISCLTLPVGDGFKTLKFEEECDHGLRSPPSLDVVLKGSTKDSLIVGIESKFTEYISPKKVHFSDSYKKFEGQSTGYSREMLRLMDTYKHLDVAQLIKHAFGLANTFPNHPVILLYLYWEPENPECFPLFKKHREEIEIFANRVKGSKPTFKAMSYPELWEFWRDDLATPDWLQEHIGHLISRYGVRV